MWITPTSTKDQPIHLGFQDFLNEVFNARVSPNKESYCLLRTINKPHVFITKQVFGNNVMKRKS